MRVVKLAFLFFCLNIASANTLFPNFKEGRITAYDYEVDTGIYKAHQNHFSQKLIEHINNTYVSLHNKFCPIDYLEYLNTRILKDAGASSYISIRAFLKLQRDFAEMDDFIYKNLMELSGGFNTKLISLYPDHEIKPHIRTRLLRLKSQITSRLDNLDRCSYYNLIDLINFLERKFNNKTPELTVGLYKELLSLRIISRSQFNWLNVLFSNDLHRKKDLDVIEYWDKLILVTSRNKNNIKANTDFFRYFKADGGDTPRIRLYKQYDHYQMAQLKEVAQQLLERIQSKKVYIVLEDSDGATKIDHTFTPPQQLRYAIKLLDKQLEVLQESADFEGKSVNSLDIITAAHELDLLDSDHLEGFKVIEKMINPDPLNKESWRVASNEFFLAGPIVFPDYQVAVLVGAALFKMFFPEETPPRTDYVF